MTIVDDMWCIGILERKKPGAGDIGDIMDAIGSVAAPIGGGSTIRLEGRTCGNWNPKSDFLMRCIAMENSFRSIRPSAVTSASFLKSFKAFMVITTMTMTTKASEINNKPSILKFKM